MRTHRDHLWSPSYLAASAGGTPLSIIRQYSKPSAGINMADAFSRFRAYARDQNLRLTDVAQAAIDGTLDPHAWAPAPPSTRS
jgi:hypothetical protein